MKYRIKEICKDKNKSISDLANEIGMVRESLSRIIGGASTSVETLQKIADALEVDFLDIFEKPNSLDTIGIIRHNGTTHEINSISDIEKLLEKVKHVDFQK